MDILSSRMDDFILFIIEDNYSQLIQYEILEKLVTCLSRIYHMKLRLLMFFA